MKLSVSCLPAFLSMRIVHVAAVEPVPYYQGFEQDTAGWNVFPNSNYERVASGTGGIVSSSGSFHAVLTPNPNPPGGAPNTVYSGYTNEFPLLGYDTCVDLYFDLEGCPDTISGPKNFEYSSAINGSDGSHQRDFIFNMACYTDTDGTTPQGVTPPYAVVAASNNGSNSGSSPPSNTDPRTYTDPVFITSSGWYTLAHEFRDTGGVLAVTLKILDSMGSVLGTWVRTNPSDTIGATGEVGGNRYGWFNYVELPQIAIDNVCLNVVPAPTESPSVVPSESPSFKPSAIPSSTPSALPTQKSEKSGKTRKSAKSTSRKLLSGSK